MEGFLIFVAFGFMAQIIDGALGMAFGVFLTTALTFMGVPIVQASAGIHFVEIFTTLASGLSHFKFKNIDKRVFKKLIIPGILGGILGAYILSSLDSSLIRPFVSIYLLILGIRIFIKAFSINRLAKRSPKNIAPLGFIGGFLDAIGGGGWGPIVTSSLIIKGNCPRKAIGTVNLAEFFVTIAQSATFFIFIQLSHWNIILGLLIGGIIAAPIAALLCKKIHKKILMILVASMIIITNIATLIKYFLS